MWLPKALARCQHVLAEGKPVWTVRGTDVTAVAFIPPARVDLDLGEELAGDVELLLAEGGEAPAVTYDGPDAFVTALRRREHRGALALVEPTLYLDRDQRVLGVEFGVLSSRIGAGYVRRSTGVVCGTGAATDARRYQVTAGEDHVRIEHWQRFSLGAASDPYGRFDGADIAPLGWICVNYTLGVDGSARAWCGSSYLPSTWFYRDHVRMHRREMAAATRREAEALLRPKHERAAGTLWTCIDASTHCLHALV